MSHDADLPAYLRQQDMATDPEALSLQVYLLTGEAAMLRRQMQAMARALDTLTARIGGLTDERNADRGAIERT